LVGVAHLLFAKHTPEKVKNKQQFQAISPALTGVTILPYQPKQCTIMGEINTIYHKSALLDSPKWVPSDDPCLKTSASVKLNSFNQDTLAMPG